MTSRAAGFETTCKASGLLLWACCSTTFAFAAGDAHAIPTQYEIVDLGADFYPVGINDRGTVIGVQQERPGDPFSQPGFTWMQGTGFTPIPALPGDKVTVPTAINNSGLVVGASLPLPAVPPTSPTQPFIWSKSGGTQALPKLGRGSLDSNVATAINDRNEVAAYAQFVDLGGVPAVSLKGYVWSEARGIVRTGTDEKQDWLNFDIPTGLNAKGDVIGSRCYVRCDVHRPFVGSVGSALRINVNQDSGLKDLQPSSVSFPYLIDINDIGLAVGVGTSSNDHSSDAISVTRDGKVTDLAPLFSGIPVPSEVEIDSAAFAVNNAGTILGLASLDGVDVGPRTLVFLTDGKQVVDLQSLVLEPAGWRGAVAGYGESGYTADINDRGEVILLGFGSGGVHGLLLIPVPEPKTYAWVLGGLAMLVLAVRRRYCGSSSGASFGSRDRTNRRVLASYSLEPVTCTSA